MINEITQIKQNSISEQKLLYSECKQEVLNFNLIDIDDQIRNRYDHIRRVFVKSVFNQKLIDLNKVKDIYDEWRKDDEYMILRGIEKHKQTNLDGIETVMVDDYVYRFIKASKRGNDVYRYLIEEKFKKFTEIDNIEFFKDKFKRKKTKLLFITLTYDTKKSTAVESWYEIPKLFNRFKANLTKQFGKISTFRVWESTERYYAHSHGLFLFEDYEFEVFQHINKDGKMTYRIPFYQVQKIKQYYPYDIDIQACDTFNSAVEEITKYVGNYLLKDTKDDKPLKTNAMIWLTDKQGYSISKDFFTKIIGKNIDVEEPKMFDSTVSMCVSNFDVKEWEFVGLISGKDIGICGKIWFLELKKPPDRAIEKIKFLLYEKQSRIRY